MTTATDTIQARSGVKVVEGKTKILCALESEPGMVMVVSKDDITAGDGAKHDIMTGKAVFANETTCNVFRLLKACGIPVAFDRQCDNRSFIAPKCAMLPYEVVVRREAHGSYLKRVPSLVKGHIFPKLLVEFFLKTKDKKWKEHSLLCDDPFMTAPDLNTIRLYEPSKQYDWSKSFLVLRGDEVYTTKDEAHVLHPQMAKLACRAFLALEKAWQLQGGRLVDFKVEFGMAGDELLLADVIDNDSWRVVRDDEYLDKQNYRDGKSLDEVTEKYRQVAEITSRFVVPKQSIVIWAGSEKDDTSALSGQDDAIMVGLERVLWSHKIVCSVHKEPVRAIAELSAIVQKVPDSVVIAYIGRSNGAGPVLSASTTVPVITVPAGYKDFPDDVWSSLRTPSNVPVMTVLEPSNAVQAALNILSARNPQIYMHLRENIEQRMVNSIPL